jgi:hypothetical protein
MGMWVVCNTQTLSSDAHWKSMFENAEARKLIHRWHSTEEMHKAFQDNFHDNSSSATVVRLPYQQQPQNQSHDQQQYYERRQQPQYQAAQYQNNTGSSGGRGYGKGKGGKGKGKGRDDRRTSYG